MPNNQKPLIAITSGDPAGIGAEVTVKALLDKSIYDLATPFVIGNSDALQNAVHITKSNQTIRIIQNIDTLTTQPDVINIIDPKNLDFSDIKPGQISADAGKSSVEWVLVASDLAKKGHIQAIATAPINKEACRLAGYQDIGHMEILQNQTGSTHVATMLVSGKLKVVHLTTHQQLRLACDYVTRSNILDKIILTHNSFQQWNMLSPHIGVAALNPHGSDGGLLGDEEKTQISPAIDEAKAAGITVSGPIPADTIYPQAVDGKYDVVLAMYHDQGHIAIKVHNWAKSISVNLGLPFIRTSVDHGTAFDISGQGIADSQSMREAIKIAANLATGRGLGEFSEKNSPELS